MTAAQVYKELEKLHDNKKRRLPEITKQALQAAMAMILKRLGEEALAREEG